MNQRYPQEDTEASKEGTAAHWVAWGIHAGQEMREGMEAPNGVIVTAEMLDGAQMLVDVIREKFPDGLEHVEQTLPIDSIHANCFGTPDVWGFDAKSRKLTVIDYKFGHRFVDEFENEQGIAYIEGAMHLVAEQLEMGVGDLDQKITVEFTIVQPRCFYKGKPVRTWTFKGSDIRGIVNDLHRAAEAALEPEPLAVTNTECGDCSGRHACAVFQKAIYSDMETSGHSIPYDLPPAAASLELALLERAAERMKGRITGLQQLVEANAKAGLPTPWHALQPVYGRPKWTLPDEQIIAIGQMYGKSLSKPGVVTPNQAAKLGVDEAVIKAYSQASSGTKLVPFDSKTISRIFKNE
jgi:hypothetical protein